MFVIFFKYLFIFNEVGVTMLYYFEHRFKQIKFVAKESVCLSFIVTLLCFYEKKLETFLHKYFLTILGY